jgi:hypothetical protein
MENSDLKTEVSYEARQGLSRYMAEGIVSAYAGDRANRIFIGADGKPSGDRFFIGTILPLRPKAKGWYKRASPTEVGLEVIIPPDAPSGGDVEVVLSGCFWYRVFPTLAEQTGSCDGPHAEDVEEEVGDVLPGEVEVSGQAEETSQEEAPLRLPRGTPKLRAVWKKVGPIQVPVKIPLSSLPPGGEFAIPEGVDLAKRALRAWDADPEKYRPMKVSGMTRAERSDAANVPTATFIDETSFRSYLATLYTGKVKEPKWETKAVGKVIPRRDGTRRLAVLLQNTCEEKVNPPFYVDNAVFESGVSISAVGFEFSKYDVPRLRDNYRYRPDIPGVGINCFAEGGDPGSSLGVTTRHAPIMELKKLRPKPSGASLRALSEDPIPRLEKIRGEMEEYASYLKAELERQRPNLRGEGLAMFEDEVALHESELTRFGEGLRVLKEVPEALDAFKLTNRTFLLSPKAFDDWYRFQLIFLVCIIPDLVCIKYPQYKNQRMKVDVIYFPTGGGKTEAYLGAVVFQMFFDRLEGKKTGVSAMTRFPLRLLSLQQIQRIADVFGSAEMRRREHRVIGGAGYDPFSTGYFVGGKNTPNQLFKSSFEEEGNGEDVIASLIKDPRRGDKYRILESCPYCGRKEIRVRADEPRTRILLECPKCGELPIYISDDEIYRYLPTFIIGTLDKMTAAGWRRHFRHIYGQVSQRCPDHGYVSGGWCMYRSKSRCSRKPEEYMPVTLTDPTPSLIIQDEMHLIRESLGCYDSHYETFIDHLQESLADGKRAKIIGATATISSPRRQLSHLYMRDGSYFPSRGPNKRESFYYKEESERVARFIVGVLPHNRTRLYAVQEMLLCQQMMVQRWEDDTGELVRLGLFKNEGEARVALKDLSVALSYNLKKMQGDAVSGAIRRMINPELRKSGKREIRVQAMTGDVTFEQVKRVLSMLETKDGGREVDVITATSMISHGVDLDSLNFMIFQGMPTSTAEYIQAYSRVGRKYPGIAFVVYDHMRERDLSHYKYFRNYHNLADLFVESVPINRWAKFSVETTLPGIFTGAIMNYFDLQAQERGATRGIYMTSSFAAAINDGIIQEDDIVKFVLKSYRAGEEEGDYFKQVIERSVRAYVGELLKQTKNTFVPLAMPVKPLMNLRDTDVQVRISTTEKSYYPMMSVSATNWGVSE